MPDGASQVAVVLILDADENDSKPTNATQSVGAGENIPNFEAGRQLFPRLDKRRLIVVIFRDFRRSLPSVNSGQVHNPVGNVLAFIAL